MLAAPHGLRPTHDPANQIHDFVTPDDHYDSGMTNDLESQGPRNLRNASLAPHPV
jgi:hypothetical protein